MGIVLKSSNIVASIGLCCPHLSHNPSTEYRVFSRHGNVCFVTLTKRKPFQRHDLYLTSKYQIGDAYFEFQQGKYLKVNLSYFTVTNIVASIDSELVLGSKQEVKEISDKLMLPTWGSSEAGCDLDFQFSKAKVRRPLAVSKREVYGNEIGIHFLEERDEAILSKRILMLSRCNKVRSALELLRSMDLSGLQPNTHACNSLLSCLLRNHRHNDVFGVYEFMRTKELTTSHTFSLILKAIADNEGCTAAVEMFVNLESHCKVRKNFDVIVYNTMISICGKANNWLQIKKIWRNMKENGLIGTLVTYRLLVCIFVRCNQNDLAVDAYMDMVHSSLKPPEDAMQAIISACAKEGNCDLGLSVFSSMLSDGLKPSLITCNAMINLLGKGGKVKLAFKVFDLMKSMGLAPDAFTWNALLGALHRANQHANALQLFDMIKREQSTQLNLHLYNAALMSCQSLGLCERAVQLLWQMEGSKLPIPTASYNLVIGACEISRKPKAALQIYDHMIEQKCEPDMFTYLSLMRSCIWGSLWDEVEKLLDAAPNASMYNAAIQGMCLRQETISAKLLYMRMRDIGFQPDGKTRAMMLRNLSGGSYRKGKKVLPSARGGLRISSESLVSNLDS